MVRNNVTAAVPSAATQTLHDHEATYCLKYSAESFWGLRHDVRRVILYELSTDYATILHAGFLHPAEAVVLALFDGHRTLRDIEALMARLFDLPPEVACAQIDAVVKRRQDSLGTNGTGSPPKRYRPEDFIIPAYKVDLETRKLYKPINLLIRLSDDCMRDCVYCNVEKHKMRDTKNLTTERWLELMEECIDLDVPSITISGGDPFMNRNVLEIIAVLLRGGIHPMVATKSHVTPELAHRLAAIGLRRMQVSIDAANAGLADLMTGSKGYFEGATGSIRNLRAAGLTVRSNCVMTHINVRNAPALIDMLLGMGVDSIHLTGFGRSSYIEPGLNEFLFLDQEEKDWLEEVASRYPRDTVHASAPRDWSTFTTEERWSSFPTRAMCSAGRWGCVIHCDGKVTLCDEMRLDDFNVVGDVTHDSILRVWNSHRIDELSEPPREMFAGTVCHDCIDFTVCHAIVGRCFRDAEKAYGRYHAPAPMCPRAPIGLRQT